MKKTILLLVLITISIYGFGQINKEEIVGTWKIIDFSANTPELSPSLINGAKEEALSSVYTFKIDYTFNMTSNYISNGEGGKWEITSEKVLVMIYDSGREQNKEIYQIEILKDNSMKWKQDLEELGTISMTLKKE